MKLVYHNQRILICLKQAMDRLDRLPYTFLNICQQGNIDIMVGVVTNHRARTSVHTFFLCEQDFPGIINSEAYSIRNASTILRGNTTLE
jgi:hypothetical protein